MPRYSSHAFVATHLPSRYLNRLCKHFAHKLSVEYNDHKGTIPFAAGPCLLEAGAEGLRLEVQSDRRDQISPLQEVVASHFERFAWQESLQLQWSDVETR